MLVVNSTNTAHVGDVAVEGTAFRRCVVSDV
jgi:hypothetical protein